LKATLLPGVFALDIGGKPILTFEAKNLREAWEVCHEAWLKDDIQRLRSNTLPLWDGKARIRARYASESEAALHQEAVRGAQSNSDELVLTYLVELDGADFLV
jgi:hypothetical protein